MHSPCDSRPLQKPYRHLTRVEPIAHSSMPFSPTYSILTPLTWKRVVLLSTSLTDMSGISGKCWNCCAWMVVDWAFTFLVPLLPFYYKFWAPTISATVSTEICSMGRVMWISRVCSRISFSAECTAVWWWTAMVATPLGCESMRVVGGSYSMCAKSVTTWCGWIWRMLDWMTVTWRMSVEWFDNVGMKASRVLWVWIWEALSDCVGTDLAVCFPWIAKWRLFTPLPVNWSCNTLLLNCSRMTTCDRDCIPFKWLLRVERRKGQGNGTDWREFALSSSKGISGCSSCSMDAARMEWVRRRTAAIWTCLVLISALIHK